VTRLHVVETSPGARRRGTIVAIPGLAESAGTLRMTARHWADRGFRVLSIDPRGHGLSPRWTPDLLRRHPGDVIVAEILDTLAPRLEGDPLVLFGHSAGGSAAAAVAAGLQSPATASASLQSPAAVVLEDPFWRLPVTPHQDRRVAIDAAASLERLQAMTDAERRAEITALFPSWPDDELAEWSLAKERMDVALVLNGGVIPTRAWPTLLSDLAEASVPVHIVTGTIAIGITADHRAIAGSLGADVTVVDGATHFIRRDARDRFHAIVDEFLDRTVPATAILEPDATTFG
jgi:pimeloyl-ACP methyl ester carboxylesterase